MNSVSPARLPQLDFLRAVAVILVIGNHSAICPPEVSLFFNRLTTVWYRGGWTGVDLFFVLSGFLVSGLLFNEYQKRGDINLGRFLARRAFKIYPAFWLLIFVTLLVTVLNGEAIYFGGFVSELLFIQNYHPGIWQHNWSLAVEEHFYIFLTVLFFIFLVVGRRRKTSSFAFIPKVFLAIAAICLLFRCVTAFYSPSFSYEINIEQTHLRIDSLFFGVFLSYLWNLRGLAESRFLTDNKNLVGLAGVACFVPAFVFELNETTWIWTVGLTMLYCGGGFLLLALLKSDFRENAILLGLAAVGKNSYSIYLWNLPVHFWLMKYTDLAAANWFLYAFIYLSGTFVLGIGTAKLVEYPILKLRDKIMPSQSSALKSA